MTSVSLKQKNPDAIAMPLTHFLINGKEVAGQVKVGCGLQNVQTLSKKISMHFIGVVLNLKHSCDSPQKNPYTFKSFSQAESSIETLPAAMDTCDMM